MRTDPSTKFRQEKVQRGVAINAFMSVLRSAHGSMSCQWADLEGADSQFCDRDLQFSVPNRTVRKESHCYRHTLRNLNFIPFYLSLS